MDPNTGCIACRNVENWNVQAQADDEAVDPDAEQESEKLTPEERLLKEMEELRSKIDKGAKKHRKKRRELKKKAKLRLAGAAMSAGIGEELDPEEEKLFSLQTIKGSRALHAAGEVRLQHCGAHTVGLLHIYYFTKKTRLDWMSS